MDEDNLRLISQDMLMHNEHLKRHACDIRNLEEAVADLTQTVRELRRELQIERQARERTR